MKKKPPAVWPEMFAAVECLSLLILLRIVGASIPPLVPFQWVSQNISCLDELHEIFSSDASHDASLAVLRDILWEFHDVSELCKTLVVLREAWVRYLRRCVTLPSHVLAAILTLTNRWHRRFLTYAQRHQQGVRHWYLTAFDNYDNLQDEAARRLHESFWPVYWFNVFLRLLDYPIDFI